MNTDVVILSEVGARLRQERERLRLNQEDFGGLAGVTRNSQQTYEAGKRPFAISYLLALQDHGVDVVYVATGQRSAKLMTPEQSVLLDAAAAMDPASRAALIKLASSVAQTQSANRGRPLPSTAALTEAFDELLEQSPGLAGADLAHELAKRLPIILRAAADEQASPASALHDADDAPPATRGGDRRAARHAPRT